MDISYFWVCLADAVENNRFASLILGSDHLLKYITYVTWHKNEQGNCLDVRDDISEKLLFLTFFTCFSINL